MNGWRVYKKNQNKNNGFCYSNDFHNKKVNLLKSIAKLDFVASTEPKFNTLESSTKYKLLQNLDISINSS